VTWIILPFMTYLGLSCVQGAPFPHDFLNSSFPLSCSKLPFLHQDFKNLTVKLAEGIIGLNGLKQPHSPKMSSQMDKQQPQSINGTDEHRKYGAFQNELYRCQSHNSLTRYGFSTLTSFGSWHVASTPSPRHHRSQQIRGTSKKHHEAYSIQLHCRRSR
jgi:hypothetical protein